MSENLYIAAMKISPIHSFLIEHPVPPESNITGRFPFTIPEGFVVFRVTRMKDDQVSYGFLAYIFPEGYETIRPHEHVILDKLSVKKQDILSGKLVNKPVCLLYHQADDITKALISGFEQGKKVTHIYEGAFKYEYVICDRADWARELIALVDNLEKMVIADGHHRTAAYFAHREGQKSDPGLFCAIMPLDQIYVRSYHRKITLNQHQIRDFTGQLYARYKAERSTREQVMAAIGPLKNAEEKIFSFHKGQWNSLEPISDDAGRRPGSADLLLEFEKEVFEPFCEHHGLNVYDHMEFISGSELELGNMDPSTQEILLLFPPVDPRFLWESSIRGEVMPAKSTWIEPRMPSDIIQVPYCYE